MKKHVTWNAVKRTLTHADGGQTQREPDAFWSDFRARVRLVNQEERDTGRHWTPIWSWATAAACSLLIVGGLSYSWITTPGSLSRIDSVEVIASHGALLIMEDEESQSTIVWVVDMQTGDAS